MPLIPTAASQVAPLQAQAGQPGAPATSTLLGNIARETEKLWMTAGGNHRSWCWPDPATAPTCSPTAFNTETEFLLGDSTEEPRFEIPWHLPDGFSRTGVEVYVASRNLVEAPARFRVKTDDLLTAITATSTYWRQCNWEAMPNSGLWIDDNDRWRIARIEMACGPSTATIAADRYHAYHFAMEVQASTTNVWSNATAFGMGFKLFALRLFDLPADRAGITDASDE